MFMANYIIVTETITLFWFVWRIDTFAADFIFISLRYHESQIKSNHPQFITAFNTNTAATPATHLFETAF